MTELTLVEKQLGFIGAEKPARPVSPAWSVIAAAKQAIADHPMGPEQINLWCDLDEILNCFMDGKTDLCFHCGEMEGLHRVYGYCRIQSMNGDHRVSERFTRRIHG